MREHKLRKHRNKLWVDSSTASNWKTQEKYRYFLCWKGHLLFFSFVGAQVSLVFDFDEQVMQLKSKLFFFSMYLSDSNEFYSIAA
jgi:hypothetical protein